MTGAHTDAAAAESLLGERHPLTSALRDVRTTVGQIGAVAVTGSIGLVVDAAGSTFGAAVALAAACVLTVLGGRLLVVVDRARDRARNAIIAGHADLPVALVQRQRERLLGRHVRRMLAETYEDLAQRADPWSPSPIREPAGRTQADALAKDLRDVARLLRDDALDVRGAALAERLLDDLASPLHGSDVEALCAALRRIESWPKRQV